MVFNLSFQNMSEAVKYPNMVSMLQRLRSFHAWPEFLGTRPTELARAGFFYTGVGDRVQCFFCGGVIKSWRPDDNPVIEHASRFTECGFIRMTYITWRPKFPATSRPRQRLETFRGVDLTPHRATELANAGFFYTGVADEIQCFYCGFIVATAPHDLKEHSTRVKECIFLQLVQEDGD